MSTWNKIMECVHETNGTMTCKKGERKLAVEFQGCIGQDILYHLDHSSRI